ncbi:hypothetical protein F7725_002344, partial [Dissostichus mawsoni]
MVRAFKSAGGSAVLRSRRSGNTKYESELLQDTSHSLPQSGRSSVSVPFKSSLTHKVKARHITSDMHALCRSPLTPLSLSTDRSLSPPKVPPNSHHGCFCGGVHKPCMVEMTFAPRRSLAGKARAAIWQSHQEHFTRLTFTCLHAVNITPWLLWMSAENSDFQRENRGSHKRSISQHRQFTVDGADPCNLSPGTMPLTSDPVFRNMPLDRWYRVLLLLWDQNNQRSLPGDLQDGPNPVYPALCFSFWIIIVIPGLFPALVYRCLSLLRVADGKVFKLKCCGAKVKRLSGHDNVLMLQWVSN